MSNHAAFDPAGVAAADQILRLVWTNILNTHEEQVGFQHAVNLTAETADGDGDGFRPTTLAKRVDVDAFPLGKHERRGKREE